MFTANVWREASGIAFVEPLGWLDTKAVPELRRELATARTIASIPVTIFIDDQITYMDHDVLFCLIAEHELMSSLSDIGALAVVTAEDGWLNRHLRTTELKIPFPVFIDLDEALQEYARQFKGRVAL